MKRTMSLLIALAITTLSMAQSKFPTKALTLSGSGSIGKNGTSYVAASVGSINHVTGVLYVQPRVNFGVFGENLPFLNYVSLGVAPTVPLKSWSNASVYVATEVSLAFAKNTDAYVQVSPELGAVCNVGKNAFVLTRLNYDLRDNTNRNLNISFGVGFKL